MTTAQLGDPYHEPYYSPPVSPRSLPHGTKRRASDDEVEVQNQFSNTFKKLRLKDGKRTDPQCFAPSGVSLRDASTVPGSLRSYPTPGMTPAGPPTYHQSEPADDLMTVDDTAHRIFVRDLDSEIAEIEAEEAHKAQGVQLATTAEHFFKIPDHLLKQVKTRHEPEMQLVLYRDPISISVPEENDAVRKAIVDARQRMRERQAAELNALTLIEPTQPWENVRDITITDEAMNDDMDLD